MKKVTVVVSLLCFELAALPVFGEVDTIYGRKLLEIDETRVDSIKSSLEQPKGGEMPSGEWLYLDSLYMLSRYQLNPVWSPDGQWIACTETFPSAGLWLIPVADGDPVRIYSNIWVYDGYYAGCGDLSIWGFTPDGEEIVLNTFVIDESWGTEVTLDINDDGSLGGRHITNAKPVLMAVNIHTGVSRHIAEDAYYGIFSPDGNYIACNKRVDSDYPRHSTVVQDINTGEEWILGEFEGGYCFTPDSRAIIYTYEDQLYKIPVTGGEEEQITFQTDDEITSGHYFPQCTPDGEWILFCGNGGPRSNTINGDTGYRSYSTGAIRKLCAFNVYTGETIEFFPREPAVASWGASFSPDGTQFCYMYENKDQRHQSIEIYIKDFELLTRKQEIQVAVETHMPIGFELYGNYPNPFNPSTTIEFSLPETGYTDLVIYNMTGQKVRELVSGTMSGGIHSVVWDGRDESGLAVSAGMYLTKLMMGDIVKSGRMMLVK